MRRNSQFGAIFIAAITVIAALVLVSTARDASAAANLVTNGDLRTGVTDWLPYPTDSALAWAGGSAANDADGNAASGSARVDWTGDPWGAPQAMAEQACVALPGVAGTYELMGVTKLAIANDPATMARVRVSLYTDGSCSALDATVDTTFNSLNDGLWHAVTNTAVAVLSSHVSARVQLVMDVDVWAPAPTAYFDNVSFSNGPVDTPTPTPTSTATNTPTPTNTPTNTPTSTPTNTPTATPTPADTATSTPTGTATNTPVSTETPTNTPVSTETPTNTPVPATSTSTAVPATGTPTETPVPGTATSTSTSVPATSTPPSATNTPATPAATSTNVVVKTATSTAVATSTAAAVVTETVVGPPPASGIEPPNDGGAGAGGTQPIAMPDTGTGATSQGSSGTVVLLVALASGAAGVAILAAARRKKPTGT